MFAASVLAKGGGLIVAILVARYLGAASLGVYAVILAVALLLEILSPLGHQEAVVRAIARDHTQILVHWVTANASTLLVSLLFGAGLMVYALAARPQPDVELALYVVAASLPFAGLKFVAQSVLQGVERMQYQTMATFVGQALGLLVLWVLLIAGAGVWAAFLSRAVFHVVSLAILGWVIVRHADRSGVQRTWRPDYRRCRSMLSASTPFALQRFLTEGLQRLNIIILPLLVTLEAVGQFNAATQITQATSTIIPIMMMTLLPVFARSYSRDRGKSAVMAHKVLKVLLVCIFPFAFVVAIAADSIVRLLFGTGYEAAVPVLQIVIWSQVFLAADSVMKQQMIASDNERAMVWRSTQGLLANIVLTIALGIAWGLHGVAIAVVVAGAFLLALDARFVHCRIGPVRVIEAVIRPFLCAAATGAVAFALVDHGLAIMLPVAAFVYLAMLLLTGTFTADERMLFKQLYRRMRSKTAG
jgi:O-antigen/teichoic acid export membrane protein